MSGTVTRRAANPAATVSRLVAERFSEGTVVPATAPHGPLGPHRACVLFTPEPFWRGARRRFYTENGKKLEY